MPKRKKTLSLMLLIAGLLFLVFLALQPLQVYWFGEDISVIFPSGIIAVKERNLLLIIQALMLLIIIPVFVLTFIFSWIYRADNKKATYDPDLIDHKIAEFVWWGVPLVMVIIVSIITWQRTYELDPYKPIASDKKPLRIEVIALQWKWLFIYPEEKIATINQLYLPVDTPIHFVITADAPMNSFWIPDLGGQIYAMPGMKSELYLIANEAGEFRGSSANISGEGFAGMYFMTKATAEKEFQDWVATAKKAHKELDLKTYQQLAAPSQNLLPELYQLKDDHLFSQILMKFMHPNPSPL